MRRVWCHPCANGKAREPGQTNPYTLHQLDPTLVMPFQGPIQDEGVNPFFNRQWSRNNLIHDAGNQTSRTTDEHLIINSSSEDIHEYSYLRRIREAVMEDMDPQTFSGTLSQTAGLETDSSKQVKSSAVQEITSYPPLSNQHQLHSLDSSSSTFGGRIPMPTYDAPDTSSPIQLDSPQDSSTASSEACMTHPENQTDYFLKKFYRNRVIELENTLYGPILNPMNPQNVLLLIEKIDDLMPSIRLKKNLARVRDTGASSSPLTFQRVLQYLMQRGLLSPALLELFRGLEGVVELNLRESLRSSRVLVPTAFKTSLLQVFSRPNSFRTLTKLKMNGVTVDGADLVHIALLPALQSLSLSSANMTDGCIASLLPLRHSLISLSLARNPGITDETCHLLSHFAILEKLDIYGTSITVVGMRRMVRDWADERRIDVNLSMPCFNDLDCTFLLVF
ncbi:hypothetical protein DL93DRAFT_1023787 [Clavulina sp. PMI_390]|nr:hypothetical protein DL93DRAFT_1023787 [Clavulina sp. PMI_390]